MKKVLFVLLSVILMFSSCTTVDSGEIGIRFHKFSGSDESYGGVEGTCRGWVWYNPFTEDIFTYPTMVQRKNYEKFTVNAKGTLYRKHLESDKKPAAFKDCETGELYQSIYARILIKRRK